LQELAGEGRRRRLEEELRVARPRHLVSTEVVVGGARRDVGVVVPRVVPLQLDLVRRNFVGRAGRRGREDQWVQGQLDRLLPDDGVVGGRVVLGSANRYLVHAGPAATRRYCASSGRRCAT